MAEGENQLVINRSKQSYKRMCHHLINENIQYDFNHHSFIPCRMSLLQLKMSTKCGTWSHPLPVQLIISHSGQTNGSVNAFGLNILIPSAISGLRPPIKVPTSAFGV